MWDVFISYSRKDITTQRIVVEALRNNGIQVWTDDNLVPGTPAWEREIGNAIENSKCLVVLMTPDSKASEWVNREINFARTHQRRIIPVFVRGEERESIPFSVSDYQRVDMRFDRETAVTGLVATVKEQISKYEQSLKTSKSSVKTIRMFISSPLDVKQEHELCFDVLGELMSEPDFKKKVAFQVTSWDEPSRSPSLLVTMTPQSAINSGLPKPSECDIVVVILWTRMGIPLPQEYKKLDGSHYFSSTEWEYEEAMQAAHIYHKPQVVVYRRTETFLLDPDADDFGSKLEQFQRVKDFFAKFQDARTGDFIQGYNQYEKPEDFRQYFKMHMRVLIERLLREEP